MIKAGSPPLALATPLTAVGAPVSAPSTVTVPVTAAATPAVAQPAAPAAAAATTTATAATTAATSTTATATAAATPTTTSTTEPSSNGNSAVKPTLAPKDWRTLAHQVTTNPKSTPLATSAVTPSSKHASSDEDSDDVELHDESEGEDSDHPTTSAGGQSQFQKKRLRFSQMQINSLIRIAAEADVFNTAHGTVMTTWETVADALNREYSGREVKFTRTGVQHKCTDIVKNRIEQLKDANIDLKAVFADPAKYSYLVAPELVALIRTYTSVRHKRYRGKSTPEVEPPATRSRPDTRASRGIISGRVGVDEDTESQGDSDSEGSYRSSPIKASRVSAPMPAPAKTPITSFTPSAAPAVAPAASPAATPAVSEFELAKLEVERQRIAYENAKLQADIADRQAAREHELRVLKMQLELEDKRLESLKLSRGLPPVVAVATAAPSPATATAPVASAPAVAAAVPPTVGKS